MKGLADLKAGDFIAFGYNYNGDLNDVSQNTDVEVSQITKVANNGDFLCHWMMGLRSCAEYIKPENVIAIGDKENGTLKIRGWRGKFIQLRNHPLIEEKI